ncbi:uncharacterized protein LOC125673398 [Ostrea edulis]|uniref:uncharacterized protein LOC125673398 n=1 Tax=Ostrea edulis TaxID=37623 RepID=UPI0024AF7333|nr:uncharacterized protein LOC125673398 [Ostrea edulis]
MINTLPTRKSTRRKKSLTVGSRNSIVISSSEDTPGPSTEPKPCTLPPSAKSAVQSKNTKTVTKKMRTDKVCHPVHFKERETSGRRGKGKAPLSNPYAKSAFVWTSDDDDFQ